MILLPVSPTEAKPKEIEIMRKKSLRGAGVSLLLSIGAALVLMTGAAASSAQEVTQAEKERALQYLETTKKNVLEATKGLSETQWNFKPAPDRWSVAAGALDVLPLPGMDDNTLYAFAGAARVMPRGSFILVPGLGVEMAPANSVD